MHSKSIIIETADGKIRGLSPVGVKKFASILDRPGRIKVSQKEDCIEMDLISGVDHERLIDVKLQDVEFKVGSSSGLITNVQSSSISHIVSIIEDQRASDHIYAQFRKKNSRAKINIEASLGVIKKSLK